MKISKNNQVGLRFTNQAKQQIIDERKSAIESNGYKLDEYEKDDAYMRVEKTIDDSNTKYYLMTKPAYEISQRIKFDENKFDVGFLKFIDDKNLTYLLGDMFYRWMKINDKINVFCYLERPVADAAKNVLRKDKRISLQYETRYLFFSIDLLEKHFHFPEGVIEPFSKNNLIEFIKLLVFTELGELETIVLKPNGSVGTRRQGKYKNESSNNVVIVESVWSKTLVREDGFLVSGHVRMQPCGAGRLQRELIWIDSYKKHGYIRTARKLLTENNENHDTE
jgi:hypothetical protein